jgi:hypothetical protein
MARTTQITGDSKKAKEAKEVDAVWESYKKYVEGLQQPKKREVRKQRETVEEKMEAADHSSLTILNDSRREFYLPRKRANLKKVESMPNISSIMGRDMVRPGRVMKSSPTSPTMIEESSPSVLDKAPWLTLDMVASDDE